MIHFVTTIEYRDGNTTKITWESWLDVLRQIETRLDSDSAAREVTRVVICPVSVP